MKIAIISDIHDNLPNLRKVLLWCKQHRAEKIICCGDVTNSETLSVLSQEFTGQIYLIRGNMEIYNEDEIKKYKNIEYLGKFGIFDLSQEICAGVCHEPKFIARVVAEMPSQKSKKIIFFGHTHQPWEETRRGIRVLNPGTVAGTFSKPTFAAWDIETKKIELIMIDLI